MKIYTKKGDKGETSLVSGRKISKADLLIESYGTVDELNTHVGMLIAKVSDQKVLASLASIQHTLFDIGSVLAKDGISSPDYPEVKMTDVDILEVEIDRMDEALEPLRQFILPGGSESIAQAHICRTVCRRAERRVVSVEDEDFTQEIMYLNRLSDYFFVLARFLHKTENIQEQPWLSDREARKSS